MLGPYKSNVNLTEVLKNHNKLHTRHLIYIFPAALCVFSPSIYFIFVQGPRNKKENLEVSGGSGAMRKATNKKYIYENKKRQKKLAALVWPLVRLSASLSSPSFSLTVPVYWCVSVWLVFMAMQYLFSFLAFLFAASIFCGCFFFSCNLCFMYRAHKIRWEKSECSNWNTLQNSYLLSLIGPAQTQTHTQTPQPATLCPGNEVIFFSPLLPRAFESSSLVSEIRGLLSACNR